MNDRNRARTIISMSYLKWTIAVVAVFVLWGVVYADVEAAAVGAIVNDTPSNTKNAGLSLDKLARGHKAGHFDFSLAQLIGSSQPVMIRGFAGQLNFSLPVPALWRPQEVSMTVKGSASNALISSSQIVVLVNGIAVYQYPLQGDTLEFQFTAKIPTAVLRAGFNDVSVQVNQHYSNICEYPSAPPLWTQIDVERSSLTIAAELGTVVPTLNNLDALFDKATWDERPKIAVLTGHHLGADEIRALGLIAQGIGERYGTVPVSIEHGEFPKEVQNVGALIPADSRVAVVLGTFDALGSYLDGVNKGKDSIIAIRRISGDPDKFLVILAAENQAQLPSIATAFAVRGVPWPEQAAATLQEIDLPTSYRLGKHFVSPLASVGAFPLRALGYHTTTYTGMNAQGPTLHIWNNAWQGRMQLRLHLLYASGMAPQSALNVLTNGVMHGTIPLDNTRGSIYENYAVTIPAGMLRPGWNEIQLKPALIPIASGDCKPLLDGNLAVTIYEDTTLQKFGGDALKEPDLGLLNGTGGIYGGEPLGGNLAIQLTDNTSDTLTVGLTLLAKMTQMFDKPLLDAWFGVGESPPAANRFWVGGYANLPEELKKDLVARYPSGINVQVPIIQSATLQVREGNEWLRSKLEFLGILKASPRQYASVQVQLQSALGKYSFLTTMRKDDETVTILSAQDASVLKEGVDTLVGSSQWAQLKGKFAFWLPGGLGVHTISYEETPFSAYGLRGGLGIWMSQYPWVSLLLVLGMIGILTYLTRRGLLLYGKKNHDEAGE